VTQELIQTAEVITDRECASLGEKMYERAVIDLSIFQLSKIAKEIERS